MHHHRPHLLHLGQLDPRDWVGNCSLAFKLAEEELGVAAILDPEDVVHRPDRLSTLTYLAQFYHAVASDSGTSSLSVTTATGSSHSSS